MRNQVTLGDRIAELRENLGLSQSELARRIKKSAQAIQKIEKGGSARDKTLDDLAAVLRTTKAYLVGGETASSYDAQQIFIDEVRTVPLIEWSDIGYSLDHIIKNNLIIGLMPCMTNDAQHLISAKIKGGDWMELMDGTIAYIDKKVQFLDLKHGAMIIANINGSPVPRKILRDGDKFLAVTTNKNMPARENEIEEKDFLGLITGFYISVEV